MTVKKRVAARFSNFEGFLKTMNATGYSDRGFVTDAIAVHDTLEIAEVIARSVTGDPPDTALVLGVFDRLEAAARRRHLGAPTTMAEEDAKNREAGEDDPE
jgi:hypothetical protein